jgi:transposase
MSCEHKMKKQQNISTKALLLALHGETERDRLLHRLHAVALVLHGLSAVVVAGMFGDSPRSVAYWVTRFKEHGEKGLVEQKSSGRPSTLAPEQMRQLQRFVAHSEDAAKPLTGPALAFFVKKKFKIALTVRQCWRILKRLRA